MRVKTRSMEETVLCGMFTALIAAGAFIKISIPVQPFPMHFTMQFFFVLLSGFLLGKRMGALSVLCYLAIGLSGVPVFAAGGGMAYLIRPTFGFLLGFVFAAFVTGLVSERMRGGSFAALLRPSGDVCVRDDLFLCDQQLCDPHACHMGDCVCELLPPDRGRRFAAVCAGSPGSGQDCPCASADTLKRRLYAQITARRIRRPGPGEAA